MEIRNFRESDRAALERMLRLAFGGSEDWSRRYFDAEKNPRLEPERVFVASENGEVRASTTVLPMEVFVDGTPAPMGGIAAVMTDPAYRRRGYARKLIEESLREMRGNGMHLSMLDPFSHAFYRASGWETACDYILYKLSPAKLPASDEQRRICAFREDYTPALKRIFEEKAARHQMCVRRCEGRWRQMLEADGDEYARDNEAVVFEADGAGVEGYIMYKIASREVSEGPSRLLNVRELIGLTRRAREGLLSFLASFDPEEFEVSIHAPRGEPLHPYLRDSYVKAEVHPGLMLRIVDVEGALGHFKREVPEPFVLEVADDVIPENEGEYTVGDGEVRRGSHTTKHRIRLDERQLSQLYSGYLSARSLAEHGLVVADSDEALELLSAYFPSADPWIFPVDHF